MFNAPSSNASAERFSPAAFVLDSRTPFYLYLVQSPLQLLNAQEARLALTPAYPVRHVLVLLDRKESENNRLLRATARKLGWAPEIIVPYSSGDVGKLASWIGLRAKLRKIGDVRRVYVGEYASGMPIAAANFFSDAEFFLLDDGASSINFPLFRYQNLRTEHLPEARSVGIVGYKTALPEKVTFFSIYDLEVRLPDAAVKNRLDFLRRNFEFDDKGPVYFIGSCMPDVEVMSYDDFFGRFRGVVRHFAGRPIKYFWHRREIAAKKKDFFADLGVETVRANLPFELVLAEAKPKPSCIATFYSTALDTVTLTLQGHKGRCFSFYVPPEEILTSADRRIAETCYDSYRKSGTVEVVDAKA
jgi:hypothetical protein